MAAYNAWANEKLFKVASGLDDAALNRDLGAFFGSVMATLNHIMVADLIWIARLRGQRPPGFGLDHILHDTLEELAAARAVLDPDLQRLVEETDPLAEISYLRRGEAQRADAAALLAHLFNHQTHHRGQVHAMLTAAGAIPEPTNLSMMP